MKFQLMILGAIALAVMYEGYLKGPVQRLYQYGQQIVLAFVCIYLLYTFYTSPKDFNIALQFIKETILGHVGGDKLKIIGSLIGDTSRLPQQLPHQPNQQRQVSQLLKKKRAADQKWTCGHCKNILDASYEVDHIIPLYKGGSNDESNLIALCRNCHGKKTVGERLS
jgi:hypothetical protein